MKLRRLDLIAYGKFKDRRVDFADGARLHVVYGPNESGKSTVRNAIVELLFGFDARTQYAWLYPQPRLGGVVLGSDGRELVFERRRARSGVSVVRTGDATTAWVEGDRRLRALLNDQDVKTFCRLHCLGAPELREGGALMTRPDSDIGRQLFAAGTGLADLSVVEKEIKARIEELGEVHTSVGQKSRRLPALHKAWTEADTRLRADLVPARDLEAAEAAADRAAQGREAAFREANAVAAEIERLNQLQGARPSLDDLSRTRRRQAELGTGPDLPEGLSEAVAALRQEMAETARQVEETAAHVRRTAAELAELGPPAPLLTQAAAIEALVNALDSYLERLGDIPKCEGRVAAATADAGRVLAELGLNVTVTDAVARQPRKAQTVALQRLSGDMLEARSRLDMARQTADKAQRVLARQQEIIAAMAEPASLETARDLYALVTGMGDVDDILAQRTATCDRVHRALDQALVELGPFDGDAETLATLDLPGLEDIQHAQQHWLDLERERQAAARNVEQARAAWDRAADRLAALSKDGPVPTREALEAVRAERDGLVAALLRASRGEGTAPDPDAVTGAIRRADALADAMAANMDRVRNFETARADADAAVRELERQRERDALAGDRLAAAEQAWRQRWQPLEAGPPSQMKRWRERADRVLSLRTELWRATEEVEAARARQALRDDRLLAAARDLGLSADRDDLAVAVPAALRDRKDVQQAWEAARSRLQDAEAGYRAALDGVKQAADALGGVADRYRAALAGALLPAALDPADVPAMLALWEEFGRHATTVETEARRSDGMRGKQAELDARLEALLQELDPAARKAVPDQPWPEAVAVLNRLLAQARAEEVRRAEKGQMADLAAGAARRAADALVAQQDRWGALCRSHGLAADADLVDLARLADGRREAAAAEARALADLATVAGRWTLAELEAAAAAEARTVTEARLEQLQADQRRLQEAAASAGEALGQAQATLADLRRRNGAADAAATRRQVAADAALLVGELARLRVARRLLRQLIDRFRETRADPMLARAGDVLRGVAGDSGNPIVGLAIDITDKGEQQLVVRRRDQPQDLRHTEMSEGTADQLFLALRLAAVELAAASGEPLPFIADDILATSDDGRTTAILGTLLGLAPAIQPILFTHHRAVVEAALNLAGGDVDVIDLGATVDAAAGPLPALRRPGHALSALEVAG